MKTYSNQMPAVLLNLGDGNWHVNFGAELITRENQGGEEEQMYEYNTVFIAGEPTAAKIARTIVREFYTEEEEAVLNYERTERELGSETTTTEEQYNQYVQAVVNARDVAELAMSLYAEMQTETQQQEPETPSALEEPQVEEEQQNGGGEEEQITSENVGSVEDILGGVDAQ